MAPFDPEQLTNTANDQLNNSAQRDPRQFGWGLFAWGDAPAACGGGIGCFQWFSSAEEALAFISDLSPALFCTFDDEEEWLLLRQRLRSIAPKWHVQPMEALGTFNAELQGLLQIDWIGHYSELRRGDSSFSQRIQEAFAEEEPEETGEEEWISFLQSYGF
jgi:hypothetical protein